MPPTKTTEVSIASLKFDAEDPWLDAWGKKHDYAISKHPLYLALKGDITPLKDWCRSRGDIWAMERLDLVFSVYKSLIEFGQLEPIVLNGNKIVTGHKRCCCLLAMGKDTVKV